ncbi:MAG: YcaO-like family protein [Bacteriovoracaceae bacterium]|nr:YcaO-like family protein [Bacteriovoracaceae bacterium]
MKLLGKACPLEETIERFHSLLNKAGIEVEMSQFKNPVEHVWSVNIATKGNPSCYVNGKGITKDAAIASGLGEYFERYTQNFFFADYATEELDSPFAHHSSEVEVTSINETLNEELRELYYDEDDDRTVVDFNSSLSSIICLPFEKQSTGEKILFPMNVLSNLYGSNGMAAGNTISEAKVQSLSEIVERFVKFKVVSEAISLPDVPLEVLAKYPAAMEAKTALEKLGFKIFVKDASLGGRFPVINVTLYNPHDGGVFANFGAHPKFQVALERTMTELCQGRDSDSFFGLKPPAWCEDIYADPMNLEEHFVDGTGVIPWSYFTDMPKYNFWPWNTEGSIEEELCWLEEIIRREGNSAYYFHCNRLGVDTLRAIVPGMSEIYPFDDLAFNNCNGGKWVRPHVLSLHSLDKDKSIELLEQLDEIQTAPSQSISALIGLLPDEGSGWDKLSVSEVKVSVMIKNNMFDEFEAYCDFLSISSDLSPAYNQIRVILKSRETALLLYGESKVVELEKFIEDPFKKVVNLKGRASSMNAHRSLLELIEKGR